LRPVDFRLDVLRPVVFFAANAGTSIHDRTRSQRSRRSLRV
jgi:hypothetical protein